MYLTLNQLQIFVYIIHHKKKLKLHQQKIVWLKADLRKELRRNTRALTVAYDGDRIKTDKDLNILWLHIKAVYRWLVCRLLSWQLLITLHVQLRVMWEPDRLYARINTIEHACPNANSIVSPHTHTRMCCLGAILVLHTVQHFTVDTNVDRNSWAWFWRLFSSSFMSSFSD